MDASYVAQYAKRNGLACSDCDRHGDDDACTRASESPKHALQSSQVIVHAIASLHAKTLGMAKHSRGVLVWHSTGSGKTCAATCVMDAFWDTETTLYFVTSPASLQSNPPSAFHDCARMFPRFAGAAPVDIAAAFDGRGVVFTTFAKLAHATGLHRPNKHVTALGRDPVFIIDEAHTLSRPLINQRGEMAAILKFFHEEDVRLFLLTGTPGDTTGDVMRLVNLLRPRSLPPLASPETDADALAFVKACRYMVTHYDANLDTKVFPRVETRHVRARMSNAQFARYVEAVKATDDQDRNYAALKASERLSRYFASARRFANALYKKDGLAHRDSAAKVASVVDNILAHESAKHYVYSAFSEDRGAQSQGIHVVAHALHMAGYQQLTPAQAAVAYMYPDAPPLLRKRRFVVLTSKELGTRKEVALQHLLSVFNWAANATGDYVHVVLASQEYNESVDFKGIQHVHVLDPLLTVSALHQTVGRAVRRCSHDQLPAAARRVMVTKYVATSPGDESGIDEHVEATVAAEHRPVLRLLTLLKLAAMDCAYFKHFHSLKHSCASELQL